MEQELALKYEKLQQRLKELGKLVVSFSGGVDSTFLLAAAQEAIGDQVTAVTAAGRSVPEREIEEAKEFCRERGIRHIVFAFDELEVKGFADNPPDRCYHCKTAILQKVREAAEQVDTVHIAEGSNMDDDGDYRPGKRAVKEAGVISPLREAGLTKAEIRRLSKEMGLETWEKPSFACLASRFAYELYSPYEEAGIYVYGAGSGRIPDREHERRFRRESVRSKIQPAIALQEKER